MLAASLLLVCFLNTPFTIDDPIYMLEAQHTLHDPLHPQAFNLVWSQGERMRASQILPGGFTVPYLFVPAAWAGSREWAAHLTQIVLLMSAIYAAALLALRLGFERREAVMAAWLAASAPAVLGAAGTLLPDVAAMLFSTLGIERALAWKESGRFSRAAAASLWLALALLTRVHTLALWPAMLVLLWSAAKRSPRRFVPLFAAPLLAGCVWLLLSDRAMSGSQHFTGLAYGPRNLRDYLVHWCFLVPLTVPWLAIRWRRLSWRLAAVAAAAAVLSFVLGWMILPAAATAVVLWDIRREARAKGDAEQLACFLALLAPLVVLFYLHLPSKYLLPSCPFAALLVVRAARRYGAGRWLIPAAAAAGFAIGFCILAGTRGMAEDQRLAAERLIAPQVQSGRRVWYSGQWGFHWYAEQAGALPVTVSGPQPAAGDIVVVSFLGSAPLPPGGIPHTLVQRTSRREPGLRVMGNGAGFFSNWFGDLPFTWSSGETGVFEVWRVLPKP